MATKKRHILFFFCGNFGWDELGCYGPRVLRGKREYVKNSVCADPKHL